MKKKFRKSLRIIKAVYYDPNIGPNKGTDVTSELSSQIMDGDRLFYNGVYNNIFPDHFKRIYKRLKIVVEFRGKEYTKYYNENEKINFPSDLGMDNRKWWEKTWVQILFIVGAVCSVIAFFIVFI